MADEIVEVRSGEDFRVFAGLVRDYVAWCRTRCADRPEIVDLAFGLQSLDAELADLAARYSPPAGRALIARRDGAAVGAVAYRRLGPGISEMKRFYVADAARGGGIGRRLAETITDAARADGHQVMRLDTCDLFHEAISLYRALGFTRCRAYVDYPEPLAAHILFMEKRLDL